MAEGNIHVIRNYNETYPEYQGTYGSYSYRIHVEGNIAVITGFVNISRKVPVATAILELPINAAFTVFGSFVKTNGSVYPIANKIFSGSNALETDTSELPTGIYIFNITVPIQ